MTESKINTIVTLNNDIVDGNDLRYWLASVMTDTLHIPIRSEGGDLVVLPSSPMPLDYEQLSVNEMIEILKEHRAEHAAFPFKDGILLTLAEREPDGNASPIKDLQQIVAILHQELGLQVDVASYDADRLREISNTTWWQEMGHNLVLHLADSVRIPEGISPDVVQEVIFLETSMMYPAQNCYKGFDPMNKAAQRGFNVGYKLNNGGDEGHAACGPMQSSELPKYLHEGRYYRILCESPLQVKMTCCLTEIH